MDGSSSGASSRIRRPLAEFLLIVAGVTVALGADSLWGLWQERVTEREYLGLLRADLDMNAVRLEAVIALEASQRAAAETAFRAVASGRSIPPDSAHAWLFERRGIFYSDPRVLTGSVTALISTGDLRLIRDAEIRQAIAAFETQIREDRVEFDRSQRILMGAFESLRALGFRDDQVLPASDTFNSIVSALSGRPGRAALLALDGVLIANDNRVVYLRRMLETNENLRARIAEDSSDSGG